MARKQGNDLLMDDELAAAFLGDEQLLGDTPTTEVQESEWSEAESDFPGQLAVDVYETVDKLVVKARTAGVSKSDLDVSIADNILTISGILNSGEDVNATNWHIQECYWGEFSRTIALPVQVKEEGTEAALKEGVLTITFDKIKQEDKSTKIHIS
ncbi:Hsp20/alpha crystallin family protein [Candidatus Saccharibacteria bacterium]|nr:Hsp20/alpha crystallin family protein [Candidatus Saccharibacteria bacterium]